MTLFLPVNKAELYNLRKFKMSSGKNVFVLGAGPCGLSAALGLLEAGHSVVVLEREPEVGGQCRTTERSGYRFDLGGHRFISKDKGLVDRVSKLMGPEFLVSERRSIIRFMGKDFKYPLEAKDILLKMSPFLSAKCLASYVKSRAESRVVRKEENTLEEWLVNRYGSEMYEIFFKPYSTKLWGRAPDEISSDWASQRISLLNMSDVILRLLGLRRKRIRTYALKFFYPKKGIGDISRRMAAEVERLGGKVRLNAKVKRVNVAEGKVLSVEYAVGNQDHKVECDFVVSTIPLPDLIRILNPGVPDNVRRASSRLESRSLRFMNILLDGVENISPYTWWYLQDGKYVATRLQEPKRRSPYSAPEGKTSVMLEIPCSVGDRVWEMEDKKLFERCMADLSDMGLRLEGKVVDYFTTRLKDAYPVYTMDYRKNRDVLLNHIKSLENLVSCGRQGLFDYIFMDDAMLMGFEAAKVVSGEMKAHAIYDRKIVKDLLEVKSVVPGEGYS